MLFKYKSINDKGVSKEGEIDAPSRDIAIGGLQRRGLVVISKEEETKSKSQYLFEINKNKTIDGAARTNTARYINHSHRPNCEVEIYKGRVFVFSKKNLKEGDELSYDYGKEFVDVHIIPKGCKCVRCAPAKLR